MMTRPNLLLGVLAPLLMAGHANGQSRGQAKPQPFTVVEATIPEMQAALQSKRSRQGRISADCSSVWDGPEFTT